MTTHPTSPEVHTPPSSKAPPDSSLSGGGRGLTVQMGSLELVVSTRDLARFRSYCERETAIDGCVAWNGTVYEGYGRFWVAHRRVAVHRFAYALSRDLPPGLTVDHLCHNSSTDCAGGTTCLHRRCVNPRHLDAVPAPVNAARSPTSTTGRNIRKTHCPRGHSYSGENLKVSPDGKRHCRICLRAHWKAATVAETAERRRLRALA